MPTLHRLAKAAAEVLREEKEAQDKLFARDAFAHVRTGRANDGETYVNDLGKTVRLDIRGHQYGCDIDGVRNTRKSSRPDNVERDEWITVGPHRKRMQKKLQLEKSKMEPQPQVAPVEVNSSDQLVAGGASSSSATHTSAGVGVMAMVAKAHEEHCLCEDCLRSMANLRDDEPTVYNQYGFIYDAEEPDEVPQVIPPLIIAQAPSEFDSEKWAVRPAGAQPDSMPYFFVDSDYAHVDDPPGTKSCQFKTMAKKGWTVRGSKTVPYMPLWILV